ncbi:MAG: TatD family hydrolase [Endomicrobium sp.]|jgi:TatD DNase family protein|nr:TatD family hydrolase [Endomicrobium sp.]
MIIDTHAHLTDAKFDADRQEVLKRAFDAGVNKIIEISCEPELWDKSGEFSKKDNIYVSYGIHPHEAEKASEKDFEKLDELLRDEKTVAIGEIGLDYHYDFSPRKIQREIFLKQLDMAVKHNKTLIIHCRSAYEELITILKNYKSYPKGVIHCFSGTPEQAKIYVEMGFMLGIDGPVTYRKSDKLRQVAAETDISKLLIETDCPYLAPQKFRGQRNEPAYIVETLSKIAEIKNISYEEAAKITYQNALNLFEIGE